MVAIAGYALAVQFRPLPGVAVPMRPDALDAAVSEVVQRYIAHAQVAPRDAARHATLGLVYEANGIWPEAAAAFETAIKLDPHEPLARYHLAIVLRSGGDPAAALAVLRDLVRRHPDVAAFQHRLGEALLEAGVPDEAARAFQAAIDLAPSAPESYVGLADAKLSGGDYQGAAAVAQQALRHDPAYGRAHYVLGLAYRGLGKLTEAEQEISRGLGAGKRFIRDAWSDRLTDYMMGWSSLIDRAVDFIDAGKFAEGITLLQRALTVRPNDVDALNNLAVAYISSQQPEKAREVLLRAERADPNAFATQINLAACHLELARLDEALRYADRAVSLAPGKGQSHLTRGRVLMKLKRFEDALSALRQAAALDTRNAQVFLDMGDACVLLERIAEAREHYEAALARLPAYWPLHVSLCGVYMRLGLPDKAEEALSAAQSLAPGHPRVQQLASDFAAFQDRRRAR